MRKILVILASVLALASMSACGIYNCKADGCTDEVYKDGYCKYHYTINQVDDAAKGLFDSFFGN